MASRQRNSQRRKLRVAAEDDDEDEEDISVQLRAAQQRKAQTAAQAKPATKLSFGEDEEAPVMVKAKKKKAKARGMSMTAPEEGGDDQAAPDSTYSAQELAQLKLSTPQMPTHFGADSQGGKRAAPQAGELSLSLRLSACNKLLHTDGVGITSSCTNWQLRHAQKLIG